MKNILPEDLLEYFYNELPECLSLELKQKLSEDWSLREKMEVIREAAQWLDKSIVAPREEAIQFIMEYAAAHSSATTI